MLYQVFKNLMEPFTEDKIYIDNCWKEIEKYHNGKGRHYHNLNHLETMHTELKNTTQNIKDIDAILFAIFYHDIIYNVSKSDNERKSAEFFLKRISRTTFDNLKEAEQHILASKHHENSENKDTNLFLDLDLAILGYDEGKYREYSKNVRKEYKIYPDFLYKRGRRKVLKQILDQPSIYKTIDFKNRFENSARQNLRNELELLSR